ncbi:isochorismatase family protein [Streptomyces sp. NPDC048255]|uniref:isochorismatase family protein n=1 Tax=Streptomyces sp. NPDC048255 TaxID=3154713 RepID=UPI003405F4FC
MPLPRIEPYELPDARCLTLNRVGWAPDPTRTALLVHDMQNYFLRPFTPPGPLPAVTANVRRLLTACRTARIPVLYTTQPPRQSLATRGLLSDFWGPGLGGRPDDDRIAGPLAPADGDTVITKHRYSAFHGTGLRALLEEQGRDHILITGVYAHLGCMLTATDAFANGIRPFLIADATADFDHERHWQALRYVGQSCGMATLTDDVLASTSSTAR